MEYIIIGLIILIMVLGLKLSQTLNDIKRKDKVIEDITAKNEQSTLDFNNLNLKNIELQTLLKSSEVATQEKIELLNNNKEKLTQEFENLANKILDNNSAKFAVSNKQQISDILQPMQENLKTFKAKIEEIHLDETKERSELKNELENIKKLNQQISTEANNLTNALKGQNKIAGTWGEMILESILEKSGLRLGKEYLREKSFTNEENKRYRPDVIVQLPGERQIVIDAKTSLLDYEKYNTIADEGEKKQSLQAHIKSINNHIKSLANKNYEDITQINTLDFTFMFVPIESALMVALENDENLFNEAFKQKIVLVSPTTLLIILKVIENIWRLEKQAKNSEAVIKLAENLYDKVRLFSDNFEKIGTSLNKAQDTYGVALKHLTQGPTSVIKQVENFKDKSNIRPKKTISQKLIDI